MIEDVHISRRINLLWVSFVHSRKSLEWSANFPDLPHHRSIIWTWWTKERTGSVCSGVVGVPHMCGNEIMWRCNHMCPAHRFIASFSIQHTRSMFTKHMISPSIQNVQSKIPDLEFSVTSILHTAWISQTEFLDHWIQSVHICSLGPDLKSQPINKTLRTRDKSSPARGGNEGV